MDQAKIDLFKQAALESGYSPEEVDQFVQTEQFSIPSPMQAESQPYDPTGKSFETIMAETGRQSELDTISQGNTQPIKMEAKESAATSMVTPLEQPLPKQNRMIGAQGTVTQGFGAQSSAEQFSGGVNYGVDVAVPRGTPIAVPPNGTWQVVDAFGDAQTYGSNQTTQQKATNSGYGNSVLLQNVTTGEKLRFSHLDVGGVKVKPGQVVEGGTVIGVSGATGNVAGSGGGFHIDTEYYTPEGKLANVFDSPYVPRFGVAAPELVLPEPPPRPVVAQPSPQEMATSAAQNIDLTVPPSQMAEVIPPAPQDSPIMETPTATPAPAPAPMPIEPEQPIQTQNSLQESLNSLFNMQPANLDLAGEPQETVEPTPKPQPMKSVVPQELFAEIPETQRQDAQETVPYIVEALKNEGIDDPAVISYALATAQAESGFRPKEEVMADPSVSARNAYIAGLQNNYEGGKQYRGRGLIQLTHKGNYQKYGDRIGEDLVGNPDLLLDPKVSAKVLAAYIKDSGVADAVKSGDYDTARVRVQGRGALNPEFIGKTREIARTAKEWQKYLGE